MKKRDKANVTMSAVEVLTWNHEDIQDLIVSLKQLDEACEAGGMDPREIVPWEKLPSEPLPEDAPTEAVAMDDGGLMLYPDSPWMSDGYAIGTAAEYALAWRRYQARRRERRQ